MGTIFEKIERHLGVQFAYDSQPEVASAATPRSVAAAERLETLRPELREELHAALAEGHVRKVRAAVERIRMEDQILGDALLAEVLAFRLDDLLKLLDEGAKR